MTFSPEYLDKLDTILGGYGFALSGTDLVTIEGGYDIDNGGISVGHGSQQDADHAFLLVERSIHDNHVFFTTHVDQDDAAGYHFNEQECPEFWEVEALYEVLTGARYEVKSVVTVATWRRTYRAEYPNLSRSVQMHPVRQHFADAGDSDPEPGEERGPFTAHELRFGLAAVMNIDGWKEPINIGFPALTETERSLVGDAVLYFCGDIVEIYDDQDLGGDHVRVEAEGYYARIGS